MVRLSLKKLLIRLNIFLHEIDNYNKADILFMKGVLMDLKKSLFSSFFAFLLITCSAASVYAAVSIESESPEIQSLFRTENSTEKAKEFLSIVENINSTYSNLYESLKDGKKIVIFMDPAHGKLPDGRWQGGSATKRQSCTNKPEEFYSIIISRQIYRRLSENPFIEVKSTDDFMDVLKGDSSVYENIPFSETISLAGEAGAFMIISEHLNNVSVIQKASGIMNIPGIHVTRDNSGQKILKYISSSYKGFLTLYNKLDASDFSRQYAVNLKASLMNKGVQPNSWEHGAVGDDRFSYFVDFPVSVIYESGFISNPREEKLLRSQSYTSKLADSQYVSMLETIKDVFKVDISGKEPVQVNDGKQTSGDPVELMKLSRLAVFYMKKTDTDQAAKAVRLMEKKYGKGPYASRVACYSDFRNKIQKSEKYYNAGISNLDKKNRKTASRYFQMAYSTLSSAPVYSSYRNRYMEAMGRKSSSSQKSSESYKSRPFFRAERDENIYTEKAPKTRTIIFPVDEGQSLEAAIKSALNPDETNLRKLTASFKAAGNTTLKKKTVVNKKTKRKKIKWVSTTTPVKFSTGIWLVNLDKKLKVTKAKKVSSVALNPRKYQNQEYLKNSAFSPDTMNKGL